MHIVFISAEVYPFSKVGGLGDVVGTLPAALARAGHRVQVISPRYSNISIPEHHLQNRQIDFTVRIGEKSHSSQILSRPAEDIPNLEFIFIEQMKMFGTRGIYTDARGNPYPDNPERFLLLSRAALQYLQKQQTDVDIIHCHDNHTALVPVYHKEVTQPPQLARARTILTLHNIAYQGTVSADQQQLFGLPQSFFQPGGALEWYGQINPLKAGILYADRVTTVSPTHAVEISEDEAMSAGMKSVIAKRSDQLIGILNGVDYDEWHPNNDRYITHNYHLKNYVAGKRNNKIALLSETALDPGLLEKPLIGMVSRLVEQKGINILIDAMSEFLQEDVAMVLLGSGEQRYHQALEKIAGQDPKKLSIVFGYRNDLSHKIMAGSDLFLMPSRYEPCGITQMYSLKYGTVPIVRKTGGLADTIGDWNGQEGNGIVFTEYTGEALVKAVRRAIRIYYNQPQQWRTMIRNGMQSDFSWTKAAADYIRLYQNLY